MNEELYNVFVYGTLKQGYGNHHFLHNSEFLAQDYLRGATMYSLGAFPFICFDDPDSVITGELYRVGWEAFKAVERLEGYPGFYDRKIVTLENSGEEAYVYFMHSNVNEKKVDGGVW